jgi:hypothetical protein
VRYEGGRSETKLVVVLSTIVSCIAAFAGCGGAGKSAVHPGAQVSTAAVARSGAAARAGFTGAPAPGHLRGDEDDDDYPGHRTTNTSNDNDADFDNDHKIENKGYYDRDDGSFWNYGHAASARDKLLITALVKRYYAVAAVADGTRACPLMYSILAEAVPEDYGEGAGPVYARGKTCPIVMSKLFAHYRAQLSAPIRVVRVRVSGNQAQALLGSAAMPAGSLTVRREHGVWKVGALLAVPLP